MNVDRMRGSSDPVRWVAIGVLLLASVGAHGLSFDELVDDPLSTRSAAAAAQDVFFARALSDVCTDEPLLGRPLGLGEAVETALCHSPSIKAAWSNIAVQQGQLGQARAAHLPTVTANASQLYSRSKYPSQPDANTSYGGHTAYVAIGLRLFDFGGRSAAEEAADRRLVAALASRDAEVQKVLSNTVNAYFDYWYANAAHAARTEAVQIALTSWNATQRRSALGAAAQSDVLQARAALAKAQLAARRAEADAAKALAQLTVVMGLRAGVKLDLAQMPDPSSAETLPDLDQWLGSAAASHPAIAAATAQLEALRAKVQQVRSEGLPTLDFTSHLYQNGYPNQAVQAMRTTQATAGITLTVPLFEGFARQYKIREAEAEVAMSTARLQDTTQQTLGDIVKAYAEAASAFSNLQTCDVLLQSALAAMTSSQSRYAKGAADVLDLLSAQTALSDAHLERVRCVSDWHSAKLRLLAAAGILRPKDALRGFSPVSRDIE